MPELPEVETIRKDLGRELTNKTIKKVQVKTPILIKKPQVDEFTNILKNSLITNICRRGKYIIIIFNTMASLVIHLGMTGRFIYQPNNKTFTKINDKHAKHNHIFFFFNDGSKLIYNDVRKFGKIWLLEKGENLSRIEDLGFEPLGKDFSFDKFYKLLANSTKNIKQLLMDQKQIVGIGNIYANEILFNSRIHPLRKAKFLSMNEAEKLYFNIKEVLLEAINLRGTTMIDESYVDLQGNKGCYGEAIKVYGKKNSKCPVCGYPLETFRIENRSTFVCPNCQKLEKYKKQDERAYKRC